MKQNPWRSAMRTIEQEIAKREAELVKAKTVRNGLAMFVTGHPYSRPKATVVTGKKHGPYKKNTGGKVHWTQTDAGKAKMARSMRMMWKRRRAAKKETTS